jgi:adenosine kinase
MAQIASFYAGAMSEAREIELAPIERRVGRLDLVVISANDPDAMLRHTQECRQRGYPFVADPSQQLAFAEGDLIRQLVDGATYLFTNEYEASLTEQKTGWSADEVLERVGTRVTTLGKEGVRILRKGEETIEVKALDDVTAIEPTGVGDAFRSGFLAAVGVGLGHERAAQVGCTIAASVVETTGTQEYVLGKARFLERLGGSYGEQAAADVAPHFSFFAP